MTDNFFHGDLIELGARVKRMFARAASKPGEEDDALPPHHLVITDMKAQSGGRVVNISLRLATPSAANEPDAGDEDGGNEPDAGDEDGGNRGRERERSPVRDDWETEWNRHASRYGLRPQDRLREFANGVDSFRLVTIKPQNRKYPIVALSLTRPGKKLFKFMPGTVKLALEVCSRGIA